MNVYKDDPPMLQHMCGNTGISESAPRKSTCMKGQWRRAAPHATTSADMLICARHGRSRPERRDPPSGSSANADSPWQVPQIVSDRAGRGRLAPGARLPDMAVSRAGSPRCFITLATPTATQMDSSHPSGRPPGRHQRNRKFILGKSGLDWGKVV